VSLSVDTDERSDGSAVSQSDVSDRFKLQDAERADWLRRQMRLATCDLCRSLVKDNNDNGASGRCAACLKSPGRHKNPQTMARARLVQERRAHRVKAGCARRVCRDAARVRRRKVASGLAREERSAVLLFELVRAPPGPGRPNQSP
jgi:hypothetical protein